MAEHLDLSKPMSLRAHMARRGLMFDQLAPYDDPERGWVDPLDDDDVRIEVRRFVGQLWKAALRAEGDSSPSRDDAREPSKTVYFGRTRRGDAR